jgi:hypothetical protein
VTDPHNKGTTIKCTVTPYSEVVMKGVYDRCASLSCAMDSVSRSIISAVVYETRTRWNDEKDLSGTVTDDAGVGP